MGLHRSFVFTKKKTVIARLSISVYLKIVRDNYVTQVPSNSKFRRFCLTKTDTHKAGQFCVRDFISNPYSMNL